MNGVAASGGTNLTAVSISVGIVLIVVGGISMVVVAYYRLQRHRADAVAMASYRKLAEQAVVNQEELRAQLGQLTEHVRSVEQLMRDVG
jgi:hypothetical protein